jgi:maltose phosphorylase
MDLRRKGTTVFPVEPWAVTETAFTPDANLVRETLFTLSNGFLGLRGAFEEGIGDADSNPGVHLAGVYYRAPDQSAYAKGPRPFPGSVHAMATFADVLRVRLRVGAESFAMRTACVHEHRRRLDLQNGVLERSFVWTPRAGGRLRVRTCRFVPMRQRSLAVLRYETVAEEPVELTLAAGIEKCRGTYERGADAWTQPAARQTGPAEVLFRAALPDSGFAVAGATAVVCRRTGGAAVPGRFKTAEHGALLEHTVRLAAGETLVLDLCAAVLSTRDAEADALDDAACAAVRAADGFDALRADHAAWWQAFWERNDIVIEGDPDVQQGMRYALFQIAQSRQPGDPTLSIGTNGMTGAMHGGLYFWDTEVYLLPALLNMEPRVAREVLDYRYHTLDRAREIARSQRYRGAMYAWQTITGEPVAGFYECTIGEQHINAAIPHGIATYLEWTDDVDILWTGGAEILVEQARFWADRVVWSERKQAWVINQVTGPDEYTGFNNNNCYTNVMARWTLRFAAAGLERLRALDAARCRAIEARLQLDPAEPAAWRAIADGLFVPVDPALGIHLQDEAFLDLDPVDPRTISMEDVPLEQHWPWERLMRAQLIKQPDVLLLEHVRFEEFSPDQKRADYAFYEPRTVHDSSLSPSIHALIAAEIGNPDDARYYLYRSTRLDLNNINGNTGAGIHLANCGGAWMALVNGVAGIRFRAGIARFQPNLPPGWTRVVFRLRYRGRRMRVELAPDRAAVYLEAGAPLAVTAEGLPDTLACDAPLVAAAPGSRD